MEGSPISTMPRSPTKVRVKRERRSLGDFLLPPEQIPVKDSGNLDFSIGTMKRQSRKEIRSPSDNKNGASVEEQFRARSKSFGGYEDTSANAIEPSLSVGSNECGKELSEFLLNLWTNQQLCDIVIRVNGKEFLAHKLALAAHSEKFTSRYCDRQRLPSTLSEINLLNSSVEATEEILRFIYTNQLNINDRNVDSLIGCAKQLGVTGALALCRKYLANFNSKNVLFLMQIVEKHAFNDILKQMEASIFENFTEITKLESFLHSKYDIVIKILSRDNLKVQRELDIFFAIVAWIDFNRQERLHYAPQLLDCVRFPDIAPEDLVQHVEIHTSLFQIPQCKDMLYNAFKIQALGGKTVNPIQTPNRQANFPMQPIAVDPNSLDNRSYSCRDVSPHRRHSTGSFTEYSAGIDTTQSGYKVSNPNVHTDSSFNNRRHSTLANPTSNAKMPHHFYQRNPNSQSERRAVSTQALPSAVRTGFYTPPPLPMPPRPSTILLVGGINPFNPESTYSSRLVEQYNPKNNHWHLVSTLPEPRHHLGAEILDGYLYVVGGSILASDEPDNLANPTDTCYRYCPKGNYWTRISSLMIARMYHGVASLEGVLYAIGGHDQQGRPLNSVEYYNPDTDSWGLTEGMAEGKIGVATAGFHGLLYVVGGFYETVNDKFVLDSVECYDPRTNCWTMKQPLPFPCCHANLATVHRKLYLVGGSNMAHTSSAVTSLSSIYRYNEEDDMWERITDMMIPRHDAGVAVLDSRIFIIGGVSSQEGSVLADVDYFDVDSLTWTECEPLAYPALGVSCCTYPGDIKDL